MSNTKNVEAPAWVNFKDLEISWLKFNGTVVFNVSKARDYIGCESGIPDNYIRNQGSLTVIDRSSRFEIFGDEEFGNAELFINKDNASDYNNILIHSIALLIATFGFSKRINREVRTVNDPELIRQIFLILASQEFLKSK